MEELDTVEGKETIIKIYYMKRIFFNKIKQYGLVDVEYKFNSGSWLSPLSGSYKHFIMIGLYYFCILESLQKEH